jgi:hypothetical protein
MPWKEVKYGKYDLVLAVVGFLGGFVLSTITMVRCRNHWQLLTIAVWRFSMSLFNATAGSHVAYLNWMEARGRGASIDTDVSLDPTEVRREEPDNKQLNNPFKLVWWYAICRFIFVLH